MKLRYLATVVFLALTTVAAHAQTEQGNVGLYFNPVAIRVKQLHSRLRPLRLPRPELHLPGVLWLRPGRLLRLLPLRQARHRLRHALLRSARQQRPVTGLPGRRSRLRPRPYPPLQALYPGIDRPRHHQGSRPAPSTSPSWTTPSSAASTTPWPTTWTSASSKSATVADHCQQRNRRRRRQCRHPRVQADQLQLRPGLSFLECRSSPGGLPTTRLRDSRQSGIRTLPQPIGRGPGIPRPPANMPGNAGFRHRNLSAIEIC